MAINQIKSNLAVLGSSISIIHLSLSYTSDTTQMI